MIHVQVVFDVEGFAGLKRAWNGLLEQCEPNHVFMSWEWLFTWWTHFGAGKQLFVLAVHQGRDLVGLFPFMLGTYAMGRGYRRHYVRYLHFIGFRFNQRWNDWMDVIAPDKMHTIESVFEYLGKRQHLWDFIDLWDVPEDSETVNALLERAGRFGFPVVSKERTGPRPYVPTTSDWQSYYQNGVNKSARQNIERRIRRLQERGTLVFAKAEPRTLMSHLASLFGLYEKGEAVGRKLVKFSQPVYQRFYRSLASTCPFEWLYCPTLELNGEPIAACFGFRYNSKYLYLTPVFDPKYESFSPGTVLLRYVMEDCFADREIKEFDFGRGNEAYKYEWTAMNRHGLQVQVANAYGLRWVGKALRRIPMPLRRWLTRVTAPSRRN
jgi:CelD/BcsL family acetyltransferase involved in cellulose biosynthesis